MARVVMKFGGTSVADIDRIRNVGGRVKREVDLGNEVAVVVSAMAGVTNQLVGYVESAARLYDAREYDTVVSAGEQMTSGLLAVCLQDMGVNARSWLGWQIPIRTSEAHGSARILDIDCAEIIRRFEQDQVAVVAGFQGLAPDGRISTLGRGGSDTSAVAFAAAMGADRCDIYTDVDGIYTTDPRIVPRARKLEKITYEEMLELASQGAKVLQTRSVEMAMKHAVRIQVLSSFEDKPGTFVVKEDEIVEKALVSGIAYNRNEAKVTLRSVPDHPGVAAAVFGAMTEAAINVDMIIQNVSAQGGCTDMTFTVPQGDLDRTLTLLQDRRDELKYDRLDHNSDLVKISVIGVGMRSHAGVAQQMFGALGARGINIDVITTSEIKISVLVSEDYTELALRALHTAYGLDAEEERITPA